MRLRVRSACLACLILLLGLPAPALAIRVIAALGLTEQRPLISAAGRHVVTLTLQGITPDDTDVIEDIYVFSLADATWRRLSREALVGTAEDASLHVLEPVAISDDGRFLAYVSQRRYLLIPGPRILARYDLQTGARIVVSNSPGDPVTYPTMSRDGSTLAWLGASNTVTVARAGGSPMLVGAACPALSPLCRQGPLLTAGGERVLYLLDEGGVSVVSAGLEVVTWQTGARMRRTEVRMPLPGAFATTATGRHVLVSDGPASSVVFDMETGQADRVPGVSSGRAPVLTDDGRFVANQRGLFDRRSAFQVWTSGNEWQAVAADGQLVAGRTGDYYALIVLDGDDDGMLDPWESTFGLDPASSLDAALDPDADGVVNRDEHRAGSHPRATHRRYFAEGVGSDFFDTAVYVVSGTATTPVTVTFTDADGVSASRSLVGNPGFYGYRAGEATPPDTLRPGPLSVGVEGDAPFAAERLTTWAGGSQVGAHGTRAVAPSMTWFFAEGATTGAFELFYLLANPGDVNVTATVTYLCRDIGPVPRTYVVPARGRSTIWVNQEGAPLHAAECGARVEASAPIVAERSLYLGGPVGFTAGTSSTGAEAPSTSWRFAAGDTREPYDTFLLLANPSTQPAQVHVRYDLDGGTMIHRTYTVHAQQRLTVWVDQETAALANTSLSMVVESATAIVAERAMWWSEGGRGWVEGHSELGATTPALRWGLAHVPESATLVFLNETPEPAQVLIRAVMVAEGRQVAGTVLAVPPGRFALSLSQLWPALPPGLYSALIDSLPPGDTAPAVPIVIERTHQVPLRSAGTAMLATPLP